MLIRSNKFYGPGQIALSKFQDKQKEVRQGFQSEPDFRCKLFFHFRCENKCLLHWHNLFHPQKLSSAVKKQFHLPQILQNPNRNMHSNIFLR